MMLYKQLVQAMAVTALLTALSGMAQQDKQDTAKPANAHLDASQPVKASAKKPSQDDGEQVFKQHCSRCHAAPDGFPSRISGTIALHMRVRASLSEREMQALLRFFNP